MYSNKMTLDSRPAGGLREADPARLGKYRDLPTASATL